MKLPLNQRPTGDYLNFRGRAGTRRGVLLRRVLDALQRYVGPRFITDLLQPAHAQQQRTHQQSAEVIAGCMMFQPLQAGESLGPSPSQPMGHGQRLHALQHRVGNRHPLHQLHATFQ
ncbi:hypothetical protein D3C71_1599570 [compost metagenome]